MSASIHVVSREIANLQKLISLGMVESRKIPDSDENWNKEQMWSLGKRVMEDLAYYSSSGQGYVAVPENPIPREIEAREQKSGRD